MFGLVSSDHLRSALGERDEDYISYIWNTDSLLIASYLNTSVLSVQLIKAFRHTDRKINIDQSCLVKQIAMSLPLIGNIREVSVKLKKNILYIYLP